MTVLPGLPLRTNIVVYAPDLGRVVRLTSDGRAGTPAWIDGGRSIAFLTNDRQSLRPDSLTATPGIYRRSWDASAPPQLIRPGVERASGISSNAEGTLLLVTARGSANAQRQEFFVATVDSGAPEHPVAALPGEKLAPTISPDGKWVAYTSGAEDGRYQIYISSVQAPAVHHKITASGGSEPAWSADGRSLYYRTSIRPNAGATAMFDQPDWLMQARLQFTPLFSVTQRDSLFANPYSRYPGGRYYDVCHDGSFLMLRSGAPQQRLVVITDWVEQLRAQLAARGNPSCAW